MFISLIDKSFDQSCIYRQMKTKRVVTSTKRLRHLEEKNCNYELSTKYFFDQILGGQKFTE